jgi:2-methylisocitrate lyase-like PEP mutase family enzyme
MILGNVWDVPSLLAAQEGGVDALGTSSAAIATTFGYDDGQAMPFELLVTVVQRLMRAATLPLSVDVEAGYAEDVEDIAANIRRLADLGVVGINLEDSRIQNGKRQLEPMETFAKRLVALRQMLRESETTMFINVRTDPFLLDFPEARAESIRRGQCYRDSGADGLFVPCILAEEDIRAVVHAVALPLNVMGMPGMAGFAELGDWGVKRISTGNGLHAKLQGQLRAWHGAIHAAQSLAPVLT